MKLFHSNSSNLILVIGASSSIGLATIRTLKREIGNDKKYTIRALVSHNGLLKVVHDAFPDIEVFSWEEFSQTTSPLNTRKAWKRILKGVQKVYWIDSFENEHQILYDEQFYTQLPKHAELFKVSKKKCSFKNVLHSSDGQKQLLNGKSILL